MVQTDKTAKRKSKRELNTKDKLYLGRYQELQKLGEGTFGEVWKAIDKLDKDTIVALKKLKKTEYNSDSYDIPP